MTTEDERKALARRWGAPEENLANNEVLTHYAEGPDNRGRICKCSKCGKQQRSVPRGDYYGKKNGDLLQCESCFFSHHVVLEDKALMQDSAGRTIAIGNRVQFRGCIYTIKDFGVRGDDGATEVELEGKIHTNEVPTEFNVDLVDELR